MNTSLRFSGAALLIGALIIPVVAFAAEVRVGDSPSFSSSETVKDDLYLAGGNVTSSGKVQGDLIVGGGSILVNGPVSEDLMIGGGSITIIADVGDDARIAGGTIILSGKIGNDAVVAGGQTTISGGGVGGDVLWTGGMLRVDAPVGGSMQLGGGEVIINSHIVGNVEFKGQKLTLGKNAVIDGNLKYSAEAEATMEAGAVVKGQTSFEPQKDATPALSAKGIAAFLSLIFFGKFLSILACALVVGLLLRRFTTEVLETALSQPLLEMGRGLVVLIVLPVFSVILLVTLFGIPFGLLGLLGFAAVIISGSILAPIILGSIVHKWIFKPEGYTIAWQTILLGVVLYMILGIVPFVGWIATCLLFLLAVGSMMKIKWDVLKEWR